MISHALGANMKALLEAGAAITARDSDGRTALGSAVLNRGGEVAR
jgi:ankyrin repeat protein